MIRGVTTGESVAELLEGRDVCICGGPGGVGKTTISAAIALGMAERGRKVAVVTIDPARRLATALGLGELGNEPTRIDPERLSAAGLDVSGELWAMMLDAKRTFDELVERLAPDERASDEILANRIYTELSNAVAGSQEFTAMAKLYELHREHDFDLVVLDTPPSRNALDFLDAPDRLTSFFEGRALQIFMRPTGLATRLLARGTGMTFTVLRRVTGVDLLSDLSEFFRALGGLVDGFKERADRVSELLRDRATAFVLVTSPQSEPVDETIFFWERLRAAGMPFVGAIVNRVVEDPASEPDYDGLRRELVGVLEAEKLAAKVVQAYRDHRVRALSDRVGRDRLARALGHPPTIRVPQLDDDVHDLGGLARVASHLFGPANRPETLAAGAGAGARARDGARARP